MEIDDDTYVVTIDAKFENRDADCVFILDKNGTPTSVSIDPVYSMGEKWHRQVRIPLWVSESYLSCLSS